MAIILISVPKWSKKGKKLVAPMNYVGFDCTTDMALQNEFSNICSAAGLAAKPKIYEPMIEGQIGGRKMDDLSDLADFEYDGKSTGSTEAERYNEHLKKMQKKFLKGKDATLVFHNIIQCIITGNGEVNAFLLLDKGQYKHMADRMKKYMERKLFGGQLPNFVYTYDDLKAEGAMMKDILSTPATDEQMKVMGAVLNAIEKEYGSAVRSGDERLSSVMRKAM